MNIQNVVDISLTSSEAERYRPDPAKVLKGDPEQAVGQWTVNYTEHEYCEILQGVSVLRDSDGNAKTLRVGDRFVIPAGFRGTWEVLEACRKVYVIFEQKG